MNKYELRKLSNDKKSAAKKILDACNKDGEVRDMSPDEKTAFDALMKDVETIKGQVAALEAVEADEVEEEPRSTRQSKPIDAPAVHAKKHKYSINRAIRLKTENLALDGLEAEVSAEIARRNGKTPEGFYMPFGDDPEIRTLMGLNPEYRDLTTTTGAGGVFIIPELPFIELLRSKLVIKDLGTTFLDGMVGKFSIPRQSAGAAATWVAEGTSVTPSNQTLDAVAFNDKSLVAATNISRKFIYQSSVSAEAFVQNDLSKQLAVALDAAALNGSGSGAFPTGILQNSTVQTNSAALGATNGQNPTFALMVQMESIVAAANADRGKMAYVTSPAGRGYMKGAQKATNYPAYIWEDNEINGYPAFATSNVPANLTKGTGTALSGIIFGNFEDLVVATWGGVDVVVNPYSNQLAGAVQISMFMEADVQLRHPESFSVILDAKTS